MSTMETTAPAVEQHGSVLWQLTSLEIRRYARQPLFIIGVLGTLLLSLGKPDPHYSAYGGVIFPAAALGVLGLVEMATLARKARVLSRAAGSAPVPERVQTAALALTCLLPFTVGVVWFAGATWQQHQYPVPANGFPFGDVTQSWIVTQAFGLSAIAALGGPLLGLLIGRWWPRRGIAPMCAVVLVAATITMQGLLFPALRQVRVILPWTYFGGQDAALHEGQQHTILLSGSPQWWVAYLVCLCGLAVVGALWHDHDARTARLRTIGAALTAAAVTTCLLAMFTGLDHTVVNPLPLP
jgi:hypothetical protein